MQFAWRYEINLALLYAVRGLIGDSIIAVADRQYDLEGIVPVERIIFHLFIVPDANRGTVAVIDNLVVFIDHCRTNVIAVCTVEIKSGAVDLFQIDRLGALRRSLIGLELFELSVYLSFVCHIVTNPLRTQIYLRRWRTRPTG